MSYVLYLCRMTEQKNITISLEEYQEFLKQKDEVLWLKSQLAELRRMIFGAKSERFVREGGEQQLALFDIPSEEDTEEKVEQITYERKRPKEKKQPLRTELPAHLPRKEEIIEPENIPQNAKKIGEEITEVLEYTPPNVYVRRIVRPKYILSSTDERTDIAIASLPLLPIPKGNAGAGLLAHIIVSKFVDHLPFYRQRQIFKRQELHMAESTINGWFNATARLMEPLYNTLKNKLLQTDYLMADETPLAVLTKDKPGATHKGYHWVYYDPVRRLVLFDYRKSRGREGPNEILSGFGGYLQADGYNAYTNLANKSKITLLACMAHVRRKFEHALQTDKARAEYAMERFGELYDIERTAREQQMDFEQIKKLRQQKATPILDDLEKWFSQQTSQVLPQSKIGNAVAYAINMWPRIKRYTLEGRFMIDNNLIENSIRPVALGRKNYLFAGSHEAAQKAAMFYSFFATCKINNIEPFYWLQQTLEKLPGHPANRLEELLPVK